MTIVNFRVFSSKKLFSTDHNDDSRILITGQGETKPKAVYTPY
jgi:hypothetical protein